MKELAEYLFKKIVDHQNDKEMKKKRPMLMCGIYFSRKDLELWIEQCYKKTKKSENN
tara:strand:+ start:135 stop:305 length:171 start_codon:yes stop_codon:yes gene_type:complete